jgi:NADH-quinone oxidoreductase subunit E
MDIGRVDRIIEKHHCEASSLIQILLEVQSECHWLPDDAIRRIGERLDVPLSRIRHIATFYKTFSLVPKGRHEVHVCVGTACHVRGAQSVLEKVRELTGIEPGETDLALKFSLDTVNCIGCCALGPVIEIDGKTHGKLAPADTADVLSRYE